MRSRLALILALAVLLGACSSSPDTASDGPSGSSTASSDASASPSATPTTISADLPDGVAATVDDTDIPTSQLQERFDLAVKIPDVVDRLKAGNSDALQAQLRAQLLGQLIIEQAVLKEAADAGVTISDAQLATRRSELIDKAGSEASFIKQMGDAALPEGQIGVDVRAKMALDDVVAQRVAASESASPSPSGSASATAAPSDGASPGATASPDDATQKVERAFLKDALGSVDVVVDQEFGAWDPNGLQVVVPL